jgi:hypothetical protein
LPQEQDGRPQLFSSSIQRNYQYRSKKERNMKNLQKMGGFAALFEAAALVAGMVFYLLVLDYVSVVDPVQKVALLVDNTVAMYISNQLIYVVFGIVLVVLALALYDRLKASSPAMVKTATVFGLFWGVLLIGAGMVFSIGMGTVIDLYGSDPAQAAMVWLAIESVHQGLGGANEIVGGLWVLLISWASLRGGGLPRALNYLGVVIGVGGLLMFVPALEMIGPIFGLGIIVWFIWLGIIMLRSKPNAEA